MSSSADTSGTNPPLWGRALLVWGSVALASIILLWTLAHLDRVADRDQAEVDGRQRVISLTNSYAEQLQISIEKIDQLSLVIARIASSGTKSVTHHIFQDLPSYDWFNPLMIDQHGIVRSARTSAAVGMSVADTRFFRDHLASTSTELKINPLEPGVGILAGTQVVRFSRRINDAQGKFAGVIALSLLPKQLTQLSDVIALDTGDVIGIQYTNGDTLLRNDIGSEFSRNDFDLLSRFDSAQNFSEIRVPGNLMYVGRIKLNKYPLEAVIAVTHTNVLQSFNETSDLYNLLQLAGSGLIIFLCLTGGWLQSRRDVRLYHKRKINSTFRLAVDASREELYMFSPYFDKDGGMTDFRLEDCNGQALRMSGKEKENFIGKRLSEIFSGDNLSGTKLFLHAAMSDGFAEKEVFIYREGPKKKCWFQARAVRADLGLAVTLRDITEIKEKENQLKQLALTDALTHLPNRHWMNKNLPVIIEAAKTQGHQFATLFIDLDNFKTINDTLGHKVGDAYLRAVAKILEQSVRKHDHVLRLGGDEFMILLNELDSPDIALEIAGHLLKRLRESDTLDANSNLSPRASIGVAFYPENATTPEGLVQAADIAMYEAKRSGKDRVARYSSEMLEQLSERMSMESALQRAIPGGQLRLYLQPRASAATGELVGFEALVRWQHPELGLVSPQRFIPLAEESHLIVELGNWVAATACETLAHWRSIGKKIVPVSINVSARQLKDPEFRIHLQAQMHKYGIHASEIGIELTESMTIGDNDEIQNELRLLADMGLELMIDDFGTGYSSLARLQSLSVDVLKIDQSFVRNLSAGGEGIVLCQAMTQMGKTLGLAVVAEGVETTEQLQLLQLMGCDEIQGYIASPPVPTDDALQMLEAPPFFAPLAEIRASQVGTRATTP
jgi:diguanylate cyclase (GGDEF)-like protein